MKVDFKTRGHYQSFRVQGFLVNVLMEFFFIETTVKENFDEKFYGLGWNRLLSYFSGNLYGQMR